MNSNAIAMHGNATYRPLHITKIGTKKIIIIRLKGMRLQNLVEMISRTEPGLKSVYTQPSIRIRIHSFNLDQVRVNATVRDSNPHWH
jgi:hypothetical protein